VRSGDDGDRNDGNNVFLQEYSINQRLVRPRYHRVEAMIRNNQRQESSLSIVM